MGGIPGAIAGFASAAISLTNTYIVQPAIKQQNLNLERAIEDVSIGLANIRAGAGGDRTK